MARPFLSSVRPDVKNGARVVLALCKECGTVRAFNDTPLCRFLDTGYWIECRACAAFTMFFRIQAGHVVNLSYVPKVRAPRRRRL